MSDSDFALRLASPAELLEMVQTLTRERDEARAEVWDLRRRLAFAQSAYDGLAQVVAALEEEEETP